MGHGDHQNHVGFTGGEAAEKITCAPEGRRRQPQADKASSPGARRLRSSREVGCRRVVPPLGDDIEIRPQDANIEDSIFLVHHWKVTVVAKGVLRTRQDRKLREAALNSVGRELRVQVPARRIRVPGQNIVRGKAAAAAA